MKHLYFLQSLDWRAEGTYYDENGGVYPLTGEVKRSPDAEDPFVIYHNAIINRFGQT